MPSVAALERAADTVNFGNLKGPVEYGLHVNNNSLRGMNTLQDIRDGYNTHHQGHFHSYIGNAAMKEFSGFAGLDPVQAQAIRGVVTSDLTRNMTEMSAAITQLGHFSAQVGAALFHLASVPRSDLRSSTEEK